MDARNRLVKIVLARGEKHSKRGQMKDKNDGNCDADTKNRGKTKTMFSHRRHHRLPLRFLCLKP